MKTVDLKSSETYSDLAFLKVALENSPEGLSIAEVRSSIRVLDALDACDGQTLTLEDADHAHLVQRLQKLKWVRIDRNALAFVERVFNA